MCRHAPGCDPSLVGKVTPRLPGGADGVRAYDDPAVGLVTGLVSTLQGRRFAASIRRIERPPCGGQGGVTERQNALFHRGGNRYIFIVCAPKPMHFATNAMSGKTYPGIYFIVTAVLPTANAVCVPLSAIMSLDAPPGSKASIRPGGSKQQHTPTGLVEIYYII